MADCRCKNCIHSAVCDELEEFRNPLWFINTKEEFICSYYTTEDVVPRSEVEVLQKKLDDYKKFVGELRVIDDNYAIIIDSENVTLTDDFVTELKNKHIGE